jgi:hypothetical protein
MKKSEVNIVQNIEILVKYLKQEKFEIIDYGNGHCVYRNEFDWDHPCHIQIDENNKVILVTQAEWPSEVLYFLFTLVKVSDYTVSFDWCDERLERLAYEVESNLEYFKNQYFN